jgi:predicted TIM-barrel fold metal-dependent hydrolase
MKIIDMHTHAQDILFRECESGVRPSLGILMRLFELQRFNWYGPAPTEKAGGGFLRKRTAQEVQGRNAMASFDALAKGMELTGITHSAVLPIEPYGKSSEVLAAAERNSRWIPFASVDPSDPKRAEKLATFAEKGCRGLKLHPIIQDFHPSSKECMETVEEFRQYELPIFFHSGQTAYYVPESESESYGAPGNYVKTIGAFPEVKFVMGHMAMFEAEQAIEIAKKHKNVYFDTSFQPKKMVRKAINEVGEERVMFGSDWPFGRQRFELAIVVEVTEGNPTLREKLLWKNAEALVGEVD